MARLKTSPVFKCKRCGRNLVLTDCESFDDPAGEKLRMVLKSVQENALCDNCNRQRNYYIQQNRLSDWEAGRL